MRWEMSRRGLFGTTLGALGVLGMWRQPRAEAASSELKLPDTASHETVDFET